ncbi:MULTISPECIES: hypothetical protein [Serratia]|jgi:hypothetical protein|uniref:Fumarate hydratase n=2 Tax=Serratia TaxID=613 RepID=A0ABW8QIH0_9GAMM|nr:MULTISPECIES: hypothetical protein [Serratia]ASL97162.1 hypothetical protein BVG96_05840 [Serratia marcescens]ASM06589.1 hypothetical protein BVG91_05865 [Serratia marcescens]AVD62617.1 hypothetical protein C4B62_05100 [Serratia marcescens]EGS9997410.1 hypothetical protein [Serratia marcescens]EIY8598942.1 hypothetical protein [Serratia marcescens]
MQPYKEVEFDHELCLAIGKAVLDVVSQGEETSAPAVMNAIERSVEQGLNDDETAIADDALDLMARLVHGFSFINLADEEDTSHALVEFQTLQE